MLSREEWEEIREVRPRTPFESKLARPNARIRTGEPVRMVNIFPSLKLQVFFFSVSSFNDYTRCNREQSCVVGRMNCLDFARLC